MTKLEIDLGGRTGACVRVNDPCLSGLAVGVGVSAATGTVTVFGSGFGAGGGASRRGAGAGAGVGAMTGFVGSAGGTAVLCLARGAAFGLGVGVGAGADAVVAAATCFATGAGLLRGDTIGLVAAGADLVSAVRGIAGSSFFGPDGFQVLARDFVFCGRSGRCENGS